MLKEKWLNRGFGPSVHIVQTGENQKTVQERKNITSIRLLPPLDKTDRTHKTSIPIPEHLESALLSCGYAMPEWTPEGCRQFLEQLLAEWPGFHVNGWHGCEFPACWPVALQDAVTSVYVQSLPTAGGVQ